MGSKKNGHGLQQITVFILKRKYVEEGILSTSLFSQAVSLLWQGRELHQSSIILNAEFLKLYDSFKKFF